MSCRAYGGLVMSKFLLDAIVVLLVVVVLTVMFWDGLGGRR